MRFCDLPNEFEVEIAVDVDGGGDGLDHVGQDFPGFVVAAAIGELSDLLLPLRHYGICELDDLVGIERGEPLEMLADLMLSSQSWDFGGCVEG